MKSRYALFLAIQTGKLETVKELISRNYADVTAIDYYVRTPLEVAILNDQLPIIKYLIQKGANPNKKNAEGQPLISLAAERCDNDEIIQVLIDGKADINIFSDNGLGPLQYAVFYSSPNRVKMLLDAGAYPDVYLTKEGISLLILRAKTTGYKDEMESYLKRKNNGKKMPDTIPNFSLLKLAVWCGRVDIVKMLLQNEIDIVDEEVIEIAKLMKHTKILELFLPQEKKEEKPQVVNLNTLAKSSDVPSSKNPFLLVLRYKDSLAFLNTSDRELNSEDKYFKCLTKAMLLGYGFTNAGHHTGLFHEDYNRDATDRSSRTLIDTMLKQIEKNGSYPLINAESTPKILTQHIKKNPNKLKHNNVAGRKFLEWEKPDYNFRHIIGYAGLFPMRDMQLWITANSENHFDKLFEKLFNNISSLPLKSLVTLEYKLPSKNALRTKNNILQLLRKAQTSEFKGKQIFYLNLMENLINEIEILELKSNHKNHQFKLAFLRLEFILSKALKHSLEYKIFLDYLEFAFDEISYLLAINGSYKKNDFKTILTNFINSIYQPDTTIKSISNPSDNKIDNKEINSLNANVLLGGSGMHLLTTLFSTAMEEMKSLPNYKDMFVYLNRTVYFEIPEIFGKLTSKHTEGTQACYIPIDENKSHYYYYNGKKIVTIMITGFEENVSPPAEKRFRSNDVAKLIEEQFSLRNTLKINIANKLQKEAELKIQLQQKDDANLRKELQKIENSRKEDESLSNSKLIVILDTTLNTFDDAQINFLLMAFQAEINSGQLAIVTAHSLNKYFHIGLDKTPAALGAAFFNAKHFPKLAHLCTNEWLNGFEECDPVFQTLAHMIKYVKPHILQYSHIIKANSRYIHEVLMPKEFLNPKFKNNFCIHNPYTDDFYKDISGFLVLDGDEWIDWSVIKKFFAKKELEYRDGYGFSQTRYFAMWGRFYRISIGTEPQHMLQAIFEPLFNYLKELNEVIELYRNNMNETLRLEIKKLEQQLLSPDHKKNNEIILISDEAKNLYSQGLKDDKSIFSQKSSPFQKAAHAGHPEAQFQVGLNYEKMNNKSEAARWYRIAARQNHIEAIFKTAICYEIGLGVNKDLSKAFEFYSRAAELGHIESTYRVGTLYKDGKGVNKNETKQIQFYTRAAKKGHAQAAFLLAMEYEKGKRLPQNYKKAEYLYEIAIQSGHADSMYNLANLYENGLHLPKNIKKALELYMQAADLNHADAQFKLGLSFEDGECSLERDEHEAINYFKKAAEKCHALAQYKLGECFQNGKGVRKNLEEAKKWFNKTERNGCSKAKSAMNNVNEKKTIITKSRSINSFG